MSSKNICKRKCLPEYERVQSKHLFKLEYVYVRIISAHIRIYTKYNHLLKFEYKTLKHFVAKLFLSDAKKLLWSSEQFLLTRDPWEAQIIHQVYIYKSNIIFYHTLLAPDSEQNEVTHMTVQMNDLLVLRGRSDVINRNLKPTITDLNLTFIFSM